ncbi:MAG TPA: DUF2959 family protein, partial [Tepidisphaeraceae bacterium]|nr:DUF2959 family protein [Tepidisphaeraceae bacterium]
MVGCSSDSKPVEAPPAQPAPAKIETAKVTSGNGITNFRDGLIAGQQQIDLTLASLAALTDPQQTDLRGAYNTYCDQLARMRETSQSLKVEADAMRSSRDVYFANWEDKVSDIDNPTIRASAEARRKRLQSAHEEIITSSSAAKDAYVPFMKDLEDVRKYLA